ncbi:2-polyprenyl-6-methoxyphenol hydroxylase-like FAD-dependent oxidoreductase [Phycicoccus badiiscoriae]|uniref:2-polyprenyl-6-methoxyphenol hydroxylase-like FAD-dependent oxidoreductase n=1 Tax=Pedococcus badiiscoriae TaxID=642776 RepID=A0A852WQ28_9MICO|nr:2-polyprenyl-6-methoxyphenol hydroxylase-like FAD-dependent oxidoreductase [Pedococcus badiiscoriae]
MASGIVVGASVAGLLTARVLSDHLDDVVVLERERLTDSPRPRGHVPQGRHLHLLLIAGLNRLTEWFPGIDDELERLGAVRIDGSRAWVYQAGGYRAQGDWGPSALSLTRPLLEQVLRRRIALLDNVTLEDGVLASGLDLTDGRVTGVVVDGVSRPADLVVDCSGRSSRIAHQLEESGVLVPPVSRVSIDCAYTSGFLPRSRDDFEGTFVVCGTSPPTSFRAGAVMPVEGERWMVTLAGVHGDPPGTSEDEVLAFARSLLSPAVAQLLERAGPLSDVAAYRFPFSQRRHYEKVERLVPGLLTLGDAACSFNPIYGQGMSCAALQAAALDTTVREVGAHSPDLPRLFHRRAATIIDAPWSIAVGADFLHPDTVGPKAKGTDAVNRYVLRVVRGTHTSVRLAKSFNLVLNLVEPTASLLRPSVVGRVVAASVPGPHRAAPVGHPRVAPPGE